MCVRENYSAATSVEQNLRDTSPGGALQVSPGRKSWVQWEIGRSPGGTTQVLTHTTKSAASIAESGAILTL